MVGRPDVPRAFSEAETMLDDMVHPAPAAAAAGSISSRRGHSGTMDGLPFEGRSTMSSPRSGDPHD